MNLKNTLSWLDFTPREVLIGGLGFGAGHPVRLQSMTNTPTADVEATVAQCIRIFKEGADLVRMTARSPQEARSLSEIAAQLQSAGYHQPLCADIHFNPAIALEAARRVAKIRINPGNFVDLFHGKTIFSEAEYQQELEETHKVMQPLIAVCREHGTAIRIGINGGSLSKRHLERWGHTPKAMVESAIEYIRIFHDSGFHQLVVSIKASEATTMIHANRLLVQTMIENGFDYPIHLGVTEAGEGEDGRIRSAAGIGSLLLDGIGSTVRVSLTEAPEKEIPVAREIVHEATKNRAHKETARRYFELVSPFSFFRNEFEQTQQRKPQVSTKEGLPEIPLHTDLLRSMFCENPTEPMAIMWEPEAQSVVSFSVVAGAFLADGCGNAIRIETKKEHTQAYLAAFALLQTTKRLITKADFVSCPSCGRTTFNIEKVLRQVKEEFAAYTGVQFAVMGCIVNGPGEMAGAKYGILGSKPQHVDIWFNGQAVIKGIHEDEALAALKKIVEKHEHTERHS